MRSKGEWAVRWTDKRTGMEGAKSGFTEKAAETYKLVLESMGHTARIEKMKPERKGKR